MWSGGHLCVGGGVLAGMHKSQVHNHVCPLYTPIEIDKEYGHYLKEEENPHNCHVSAPRRGRR